MVRHSQDLGKRARLERAAASSIKKQRDRERLRRLYELQMQATVGDVEASRNRVRKFIGFND